jgi:hypothetical protein
MTKGTQSPSYSSALGFWAQHAELLDTLYETGDDDYLPADEILKSVIPDSMFAFATRNRSTLVQIMQQSELDLKAFNVQLKNGLIRQLEEVCSINPTKANSPWDGKVSLSHRDGRVSRSLKPMEIGWGWATMNNTILLECWIWVPGGRASERRAFDFIRSESRNESATPAEWLDDYHVGAIRLRQIELTRDSEFRADMSLLLKQALECFRWTTPRRLDALFRMQRADL